MRPAFGSLLRLVAVVGVAVPLAESASQRYVAPTQETVFSRTEARDGDPPAHLIYVENRSTVSVTVFSLSLTGCENVKAQCHPQSVKLRIGPGSSRMVIRVEPRNPMLGFTYRFGFNWRADSAGVAAVEALAAAGSSDAQRRLDAKRRTDSLDRATPGPGYNELTRDDFTALGTRVAALRAVPDSLVMAPGERTSLDRVRLVLVDSQGVILGRTRWLRWRYPTGGTVEFTPSRWAARPRGRS